MKTTHLDWGLNFGKTKLRGLIIGSVCAILTLTACPSNTPPTNPASKIKAPKISGAWRNLGSVSQGNVVVSYDTGSLRRNGDLAYLRDRKIVINPDQERYVGTPKYKVAVSDWEFHCKNKSFRITAIQFLDEKGRIVSQERYTANPIPPMPIAQGTIADKQFAVACR